MKISKRKVVRFLIIFFLAGCGCEGFSQALEYKPSKNASLPRRKYQSSEENLKKAYEAYNQGNLEKTNYYLKQSENDGAVSAQFYMLLGQYHYDRKEYSSAKRYWKRGYRKMGCFECKEKIATISG